MQQPIESHSLPCSWPQGDLSADKDEPTSIQYRGDFGKHSVSQSLWALRTGIMATNIQLSKFLKMLGCHRFHSLVGTFTF